MECFRKPMLKITTKQFPQGVVLVLQGKISIGDGDCTLRDTIGYVLASGQKNVVLDLAGVQAIDASGIGELAGCYTTVRNRGGAIKLLKVPVMLNEKLHVTQLITIFEVYDDEAEAVASFD